MTSPGTPPGCWPRVLAVTCAVAIVATAMARFSASLPPPPPPAAGAAEKGKPRRRGKKKAESPPPDLFVFGLGYCGSSVARAVLALGGRVAGTVREEGEGAEALRALGIDVFAYDPGCATLSDAARKRLRAATHVLSTAQPSEVAAPAAA